MPDDPIPPVPPSGWKQGDKENKPEPDKGEDEKEENKSA